MLCVCVCVQGRVLSNNGPSPHVWSRFFCFGDPALHELYVAQSSTRNGCRSKTDRPTMSNNNSSKAHSASTNNDDNDGWATVPTLQERRKNKRRTKHQQQQDEPPPPIVEYIPPPPDSNSMPEPFLLMLVGLPGSGKSTFAKLLVEAKPWMYQRINQDTLGSRRACLDATRHCLRAHQTTTPLQQPYCPILDRCNFDPSQRQPFLQIAHQHGKIPVDCIVFHFPAKLCIARCQRRANHETVAPQDAAKIVHIMERNYAPPITTNSNNQTRRRKEPFRTVHIVSSHSDFGDMLVHYLGL